MLAVALCVVAIAAIALLRHEVARERRTIIERRLLGAAEILAQPAQDVLNGTGSREGFLERLRDLGSITGLRITLIGMNGDVLADSDVRGPMPNLGDRPEVRAASLSGFASAARTSALTGKETVYVAHAIEADGQRLGTIRAATDSSELDTVLSGMEWIVALVATASLGLGLLVGLALRRRATGDARDEFVVDASRAPMTHPTIRANDDAPSLVRPATTSTSTSRESHAVARDV